MSQQDRRWLVETDWLAQHLEAPDLVIFDASWHLPGAQRDPKAEYLSERIPGALFFDIDDIRDENSDLPHMLPSTVKFASRMKQAGVGDGTRIVVYDTSGIFSAARVWWTFRVMGHDDVVVLNGGFPKWLAEGRAVDDGAPVQRTSRHYTPRLIAELVRDIDDMRGLLNKAGAQIADARPAGRFEGLEPEPRAGLRLGHIPGSCNIPFANVLNEDGTMKSDAELAKVFANAGIDPHKPVITTCGSGVSAAVLALALAQLGQTNASIYDGSWAEWGMENGLPVATGTGG